CRRREQVVPPLRVPEPWQVDRHEVCVLGESGPHLLEREEALRPRAQENSRYVTGVTFGIPDRQAINLSESQAGMWVRFADFPYICFRNHYVLPPFDQFSSAS